MLLNALLTGRIHTNYQIPVSQPIDITGINSTASSIAPVTTVLECDQTIQQSRFTLLQTMPSNNTVCIDSAVGIELFVISGNLSDHHSEYPGGSYLRYPLASQLNLTAISDCCLLVKANHFHAEDKSYRTIDTRNPNNWLPGPTTETQIFPLHGFKTANTMLLRWNGACNFRPHLNPQGEEILVLSGQLHDGSNRFPTGSWLRTPVEDWRHWHGTAETQIYYKNGHFPSPQTP